MNGELWGFIAGALIVGALFGCMFLSQRGHYERLLADLRCDNIDLRNRMYASKGQPPAGVDMKADYAERRQARDERRRNPAQKSAPDPMKAMRDRLAENEQRRAGKPT